MRNLVKTIDEIKNKVGLRFHWYIISGVIEPYAIEPYAIEPYAIVLPKDKYKYIDNMGPYNFKDCVIRHVQITQSEWYKYNCKLKDVLY